MPEKSQIFSFKWPRGASCGQWSVVRWSRDRSLDMKPLTFIVEQDNETGWFSASWDDPNGGGITTQAKSLAELPNVLWEPSSCPLCASGVPLEGGAATRVFLSFSKNHEHGRVFPDVRVRSGLKAAKTLTDGKSRFQD